VKELITAIQGYRENHNKPFIWTAEAAGILEKVKRGRAALDKRLSA
jgi:hypothetical protein